VSNIDAASAIAMAEQHGHVMSGACQEAYSSAALNSWHPDPKALSKLTMSLLQMELVESLWNGHALSNSEVEQLRMVLSASFEVQVSPLDQAEILSVNQKRFITDIRKKFQVDQEFFASKANAALNNYSKKNGVSEFPFCCFSFFFAFKFHCYLVKCKLFCFILPTELLYAGRL
jgi:hypothetical protein